MRIVLDTSVLVSALLFSSKGNPALIYQKAKQREFEVFLSPFILQELERILIEKFRVPLRAASGQITRLRRMVSIVEVTGKLAFIKEKSSDNLILETALNAHADYLVTSDKAHILPLKYVNSTKIVFPAQFLKEYEGAA